MRLEGCKFFGLLCLMDVLVVGCVFAIIWLKPFLYQAQITVRVGDPHFAKYLETTRLFNFDVEVLTADLFLQGVTSRLTNNERVTLLATQSNEIVDDDRRIVAALRKVRSLQVKQGWLTLTCSHADKELPERLVTLYLEEWDVYLKRLGSEKIQSRINELEQRLEEEQQRLKELREYATNGGARDEIERLERVTMVTLPERISVLAKASPYDEVGYIIRVPSPSRNSARRVEMLDCFLVGSGALVVGAGALVVVIFGGVAAWQLITSIRRRQRGVVSRGVDV